jgi:hypothetical protein
MDLDSLMKEEKTPEAGLKEAEKTKYNSMIKEVYK